MSDTRVPTPETLEVKRRGRHRLIGAITLAVLAVVIIPMVLDSEPRKVGRDLPLAIPAKEGLPALPPPSPEPAKPSPEVAKPAADAPATPAVPTTAPAEKAAEKASDRPDAKPAEKLAEKSAEPSTPVAKVADVQKADKPAKSDGKADAKAAAKAEAKAEKPAGKANDKAAKLEGFAIQLGAFSDADKLAALKAKMKAAKVPVFTETVKTSGGSLTRLRAGPYKTREQADKALAQVKKAGADGQVVPLP